MSPAFTPAAAMSPASTALLGSPIVLTPAAAAAMSPASTALPGPPIALTTTVAAEPPESGRWKSVSDSSGESDSSPSDDSPVSHVAPRQGRALDYVSSGDPCLDFFLQVITGATPAVDVVALLDAAWSRDSHKALKLVGNLSDVRGLGKANMGGFYAAALWMHERHPRTLALNLPTFARFGCIKDLREILYRVLQAPRDDRKDDADDQRARRGLKRCRDGDEAEAAKEAPLAQALKGRYSSDDAFRLLYDSVAETFAELLKSDFEHLRAGDTAKIGLAPKWCPLLDSSYDRATLLCEAIARRIFPRESSQEYLNISDEDYADRVRDRLHRDVLAPLRKALNLPEKDMSACKWDELPYARVAAAALQRFKEEFPVAGEVRAGRARLGAGAVLPHETIDALLKGEHDESAEDQWRRTVAELAAEDRLANCIAVCGVSDPAATDPAVTPAVALGLLISELSMEPWKGRVITFGETHQLHKVDGTCLKDKLGSLVAAMAAGKKGTNLQGVFNKILELAMAGGLSKDMMVRVFVLSDMDCASAWETALPGIRSRFASAGFTVPEVVFWNVGKSMASMAVVPAQAGATLVSGYSKNLVRLFLEADGELTPAAIMTDAISGPEYDALKVFD